MNRDEPESTKRDADGRYAHGLDAVCVCGHRKGEHDAARPHQGDFEDVYCEKFTKTRASK